MRGASARTTSTSGQRFRNAYEQSKFEAECLLAQLRRSACRSRCCARASSWASATRLDGVVQRALLAAARVCAGHLRGAARAPSGTGRRGAGGLRGRRDLRAQPGAGGRGCHLPPHRGATTRAASGSSSSSASAFFRRPAPRLIDPALYRRVLHPLLVRATRDERHRRALSASEAFFPYFAMQVSYDDRRSRVALRGAGIRPTPLGTYFDRLLEFALAAEWGRREIPRANVATRYLPLLPYGRAARVRRTPRVRRAGELRPSRPSRRTAPRRTARQPGAGRARSARR